MKNFTDKEKTIVESCIAEELLQKQRTLNSNTLFSIDLLNLVNDLIGSFDSLFTIGVAIYQITSYKTHIKEVSKEKGLGLTDENIESIIRKISERTGKNI